MIVAAMMIMYKSLYTQQKKFRLNVVLPPPTGLVTSLAVLSGFRMCDAASPLMDMLHERVREKRLQGRFTVDCGRG